METRGGKEKDGEWTMKGSNEVFQLRGIGKVRSQRFGVDVVFFSSGVWGYSSRQMDFIR